VGLNHHGFRQHWLMGEALALCIVLTPARIFARWTLHNTKLSLRAATQVLTAGGTFVFLLPELIFALQPGRGWTALWSTTPWVRGLELQSIGLLACVGI
jgi:hypothetical protein